MCIYFKMVNISLNCIIEYSLVHGILDHPVNPEVNYFKSDRIRARGVLQDADLDPNLYRLWRELFRILYIHHQHVLMGKKCSPTEDNGAVNELAINTHTRSAAAESVIDKEEEDTHGSECWGRSITCGATSRDTAVI